MIWNETNDNYLDENEDLQEQRQLILGHGHSRGYLVNIHHPLLKMKLLLSLLGLWLELNSNGSLVLE